MHLLGRHGSWSLWDEGKGWNSGKEEVISREGNRRVKQMQRKGKRKFEEKEAERRGKRSLLRRWNQGVSWRMEAGMGLEEEDKRRRI